MSNLASASNFNIDSDARGLRFEEVLPGVGHCKSARHRPCHGDTDAYLIREDKSNHARPSLQDRGIKPGKLSLPLHPWSFKFLTPPQNGLGAFILQCRRLDFHYCDWAGSSRGMNAFLASPLLASFSRAHPQIEIRVSPRPRRHPVIKGYYINGREKAVCVRNLEKEQVLQKARLLMESSGLQNRRIRGKNVESGNENVRGMWSPYHGGLRDV